MNLANYNMKTTPLEVKLPTFAWRPSLGLHSKIKIYYASK